MEFEPSLDICYCLDRLTVAIDVKQVKNHKQVLQLLFRSVEAGIRELSSVLTFCLQNFECPFRMLVHLRPSS